MKEQGKVILKEETVLEKFDGEGKDRVLRERIALVNQEIVQHDFFDEEGKLIEGGNNATN